MHTQKHTPPTLCVLTQTATEVRPYYREFFAGLDLFFVTFKERNPDAVEFLPGSTWSDGRNRLWEHVKGRYDYYLFIDDDLEFFGLPTNLPTSLSRLLQIKMVHWQEKQRLPWVTERVLRWVSYQKASPTRFRRRLYGKLRAFRPHVASVALTWDGTPFHSLDRRALNRGRRARPLGWFDAQVTLFSDLGARLLLPYDTGISGWWSSQIPIYVLAHLAFKDRAINILDLASRNPEHTIYRPGYDGVQDCLSMSAWLSPGITDPNCDPINRPDGGFIDHDFAQESTKKKLRRARPGDGTLESALKTLGESFDLHHPYVYERHRAMVDALDAPARKEAHG